MKRFNKKGFTIVELVIVIAVIGILAGVLIPTFSSITQKAQQSAALQEATGGRNAVLALTNGSMPNNSYFYVGEVNRTATEFKTKFVFIYDDGAMTAKDFTDTVPVPTSYSTNKYYVCYINDEIAKGKLTYDTTNKKASGYLAEIAELVGMDVDAEVTFNNTSTDYFTLTQGADANLKEVHIYWSPDVQDSLIIFLGNNESAN